MQNNEKVSKVSIGDKINDFVQKNRRAIFITFGVIIFLFVGTVVYLSISDNINKKAIAGIEDLNKRYEVLIPEIDNGIYGEQLEQLIADLEIFAHKTGGYAGSKAWSIIAQIHSRKEEWQQAEETWLKAAHKGVKTYLGPIALFNAAAAAEEQGKMEQAIELLEQCLSHKFEFPAAPRAQFSVGRINEQLGNTGAAMEAYRIVLINWPDMPVWQQLARSRITALEIQ